MPVFGSLISKTAVARFTRTLGTLMSSGVPVLQALNIVRTRRATKCSRGGVDQSTTP
jgi:type IV pilus assembly protein PilC